MAGRPLTIVTGGSRGIGAATCVRLAADGHDVVLAYQSAASRAEETAAAVRAAGARCVAVECDVADAGAVDALFEAAAGLGDVTGLVNNAGITGPVGRLVEVDAGEFARLFAVNVIGVLLCCRRAAQVMGKGGAIVNLSSGAATLGGPFEYVHYASSKAAVDTITIGLSKELGPDGIRVNAVAPGAVYTEIHADPERPARIGAQTPLGRAGDPEEIAAAIAWLLSDDASYTTGAILRVAGGR
jgi:NAD(P)-dependent dehydrogenase (short-subunit alcohol dehydrogenase family)